MRKLDPIHTDSFPDERRLLSIIERYWAQQGKVFNGRIINYGFSNRNRCAVLGIRSEGKNGWP